MRSWTAKGDIRAIDAEEARSISIAKITYEKKVCSVIFFEKFLSLESLSWSAARDLDGGCCCCWDDDFCGSNDGDCCGDDGCVDGCLDGCNGGECDGSVWL